MSSVTSNIDFQDSGVWSGLSTDSLTLTAPGLTVTSTGGTISQYLGASVQSPSDNTPQGWTREIDAYNDTPEGLSLTFDQPQSSVTVTLYQLYNERQFSWTSLDTEIADVTIHFSDGSSTTATIKAVMDVQPGAASLTINSADFGNRTISGIDLAPDPATPYLPPGLAPIYANSYNASHPLSEFTLKAVSFTHDNAPVQVTLSENGAVVEALGTPAPGAILADTGVINFTDADLLDAHTVSAVALGVTQGSLTASLATDSTGGATGQINWTYNVDATKFEYLAVGQNVVENFQVTIDDGHGGQVTQNVAITVTGTNDAPKINLPGSVVTGSVTERVGLYNSSINDTAAGVVAFTDVDLTDTHTKTVAAVGTTLGSLTLGAVSESGGAGSFAWNYSVADKKLDYLGAGQTRNEVFNVTVNDGHGGTATQAITVTLTGVNDGPTAVKDTLCVDAHDSTGNVWNTVLSNDTDPDLNDTKTIVSVNNSTTNGMVLLNTATKSLVYIAAADEYATLVKGSVVDKFTYTMADSAGATSTATVEVTVKGVANTDTGGSCGDLMIACKAEVMDGKGGNDVLIGSNYDDVLKGGDGCDTLTGGRGADVLYGGKGEDLICGSDGDDIILGGDGCNILSGGSGRDYFVMSSLTDKDTILDFEVGKDHLYFADGVSVTNVKSATVLYTQSTVLNLSNGGQVMLVGVKNVSDWHSLL